MFQSSELNKLLELVMANWGTSPLSSGELSKIMEQVKAQLGPGTGRPAHGMQLPDDNGPGEKPDPKKQGPKLTPQKVLVILGLIAGSLEVNSILIDREQAVQIILIGSLKRKTRLDRMLDEIGGMPFDDVLRAVLGRL